MKIEIKKDEAEDKESKTRPPILKSCKNCKYNSFACNLSPCCSCNKLKGRENRWTPGKLWWETENGMEEDSKELIIPPLEEVIK